MKRILIVFILFWLVFLTSCNSTFLLFYGVHNPEKVTKEEILFQAKKMKIDTNEVYVLIKGDKENKKNNSKENVDNYSISSGADLCVTNPVSYRHNQPLQVLYFNREGKLISFHNNCYAGGFPNLKWDKNHVFSSFPPKTQIPLDSIFTLRKVLENVYDLNGIPANRKIGESDFYVVVFWNIFMKRQSRRLIEIVNDNIKLAHSEYVITTLYVNDDTYFSELVNEDGVE